MKNSATNKRRVGSWDAPKLEELQDIELQIEPLEQAIEKRRRRIMLQQHRRRQCANIRFAERTLSERQLYLLQHLVQAQASVALFPLNVTSAGT